MECGWQDSLLNLITSPKTVGTSSHPKFIYIANTDNINNILI